MDGMTTGAKATSCDSRRIRGRGRQEREVTREQGALAGATVRSTLKQGASLLS